MQIIKNNFMYGILALLTTFSFTSHLSSLITSKLIYLVLFLVFIGLFIFYKKCYKNIDLSIKYKILSGIISVIFVLGYSYQIKSTGYLFWGNIPNFLISVIKVVGFYYFINLLIFYLLKFLKYKFKESNNKIIKKFTEKPFLFSCIFLTICYGIYLLMYYPGIINYDNANQIKEFLGMHTRYLDALIPIGNSTLTNFNPIVHTTLLGGLVKFGLSINNFNLGLFLYTLMQMLIVILIYSYAISYSIKIKCNNKISFIILVILGIVPIFAFYSITAVKDTLYTAFLVLFSVHVLQIIQKDKLVTLDYLKLFMSSILVILFRNNGIFIILLTVPFLIYKNKKGIILTFLTILVSFYSFNHLLLPALKVAPTSIRETLSVPFQQTARLALVKNYPFTKEEEKIIRSILDYDNLAKDYNPDLADPVKNKFNKYYKDEDLKKYFGVWFKGLVKYPLVYVDATINNITSYFYPFESSWKVYHKLNRKLPEAGFDYHYLASFEKGRTFLHDYEILTEFSPVGIFLNIGIITWLSILTFLSLANKNKYYIFMLPNIISILFCILSPANTYYRYIYPSLVLMVTLFPLLKNISEK